ncbi:DUF368 domain-containing protein [Luminiphilus sp.]|nr:DUF368 domain-containing protein [Luminiphilus sp.]|tara:strand:+ start:2708 stop:3619 length:912 start_codon:yes stop_codon:yes gene_type:complete
MKPSPIGIYARGVAMGAADVVPGVSGGTVALITGIYARLLGALVNIDKQAIVLFFTGRWGALWYRLDGPFLAWLFAGILTAIFSLASAIHWLLLHYPQPLWSFFSGLILISGALLLRSEVSLDRWSRVGFFASGCALAVAISLAPPIPFSASLLGFFIAGTIAICAMILPGISGSFMLVLLGMYGPVLGAVKGLQFAELSVFALGCAVGLITFARILNFLLLRARAAMMAFLSGVLLGSLSSVWPWQITVLVDSMGGPVELTRPVLPFNPLLIDPQILPCLASFALGLILVWSITALAGRKAS